MENQSLSTNSNQIPILNQVFVLILVFLISLVFVSVSINLFAKFLFHIDATNLHFSTPREVAIGKFFQVYQMLFLFGLPTFLMSRYLKISFGDFYKLNKGPAVKSILFATILLLAVIPFNDWLIRFNGEMKLPHFMHSIEEWMRNSEDTLTKQMLNFLKMDSLGDLFLNLIVVALLPAIMEELFFRGLIQGLVSKWLRNPHISILITAVFFSAVHMQFYGFLPRLLLGVFLGYLYHWSGNLWTAIYFHFLNNMFSVVFSYLVQHAALNEQKIQNMNQSNFAILFSFAVTAAAFLLLANYYSKKRNKDNDWKKVYTASKIADAEIMKGKLDHEEIIAVIVNKKDFFFTPTGKAELMVKPEDFEKAIAIINSESNE